MTRPRTISTCLVLAIALGGAACGDDSGSTGGGGAGGAATGAGGQGASGQGGGNGSTEAVAITFRAKVGDAAFACGTTFDGLGTSGASAELSDFRLYVHDVRLSKGGEAIPVALDQDGVWQLEGLALLDFENKTGKCSNGTAETNVTVRGTVPAGTTFDGIAFRVGVPFELNHGDASTAPSPLNLSALFWNWQGGRKFVRADAFAAGASAPFNLHLGSTGCDGDPATGGVTSCSKPNVASIALDGFDSTDKVIVVDYAALVAGVDLATDQGGAPGCMSGATDPECGPILASLGLEVASGAPSTTPATAFRVE
jgi:uncharacterized repeat protein (TIGR04052 family)